MSFRMICDWCVRDETSSSGPEPSGQPVRLSLALWTMLALPYSSLSWENSFGFRLSATDWKPTLYRPS
jgi:hypothetical protein